MVDSSPIPPITPVAQSDGSAASVPTVETAPRSAPVRTLILAVCSVIGLVAGGGLVVRLGLDAHISADLASQDVLVLSVTFLVSVIAVLLSGRSMSRIGIRIWRWRAGISILGLVLAMIAGEYVLRSKLPPWPARALHGVQPQEWAKAVGLPSQQGLESSLNSWGQRDRVRSRNPDPKVRRIAFIGDSFLEEGSSLPVSLATERKIGQTDIEVLNLGVSATGPDEYFERLRGVAAPLGTTHCCLFIFAGNDFVSPARTLPTYAGLAAVEPRPSLLAGMGLVGWNHVLTQRQRPVVQAWLQGATLAKEEAYRAQVLKQVSDDDMRMMLLNAAGLEGTPHERLSAVLHREGIEAVFALLRNPDADKYRSYYLTAALLAASDENWSWEKNSDEIAWQWMEQSAAFCRRHRIDLTIVLIPEAFQVDDRMREQWLPLADLRQGTAPCRVAASSFAKRVREAGLDLVDLHESLTGSRGTYLNVDGHWSNQGVDRVSSLLASHLTAVRTAK